MGRKIDPNCKTRLEAQARAERVAARKEAFRAKAQKMFSMYQQGVSLTDIGKQFGFTRERARQYISAVGGSSKDSLRYKQTEEKKVSRKLTQDAKLTIRYGMDADVVRQLIADGVTRSYQRQVRNSKQRGIEWKLTFAQWFSIWQASGKLHLRGRGIGRYVMSRILDNGAYELGNVHIQLVEENSREAVSKWKGKVKTNRGVFCLYPGRELSWLAIANRKRLGFFKTESEAVEARKKYFEENGLQERGLGSGKGWTLVPKNKNNPYLMQVCGRQKAFATAEEANTAYLEAVKEIAESRNHPV